MPSLSIVGIKVTINPTIPRMKKIQSAIRLLLLFSCKINSLIFPFKKKYILI